MATRMAFSGHGGAALRSRPAQSTIGGLRVRATCLTPFDLLYAPSVASWVRSDRELSWVAPGTPPPLSGRKVADWAKARSNRYLLWLAGADGPSAYSELEFMPGRRDQMWIGHLLVDPECRGRGTGLRFVDFLLGVAFLTHAVSSVLLVVVPENRRAIRCYERAGLAVIGQEHRHFKSTRRSFTFLQMGIDRKRYLELAESGRLGGRLPSMLPTTSAVWGAGDSFPSAGELIHGSR